MGEGKAPRRDTIKYQYFTYTKLRAFKHQINTLNKISIHENESNFYVLSSQ